MGTEELDCLWFRISTQFQSKHRGRLGPTNPDDKEISTLNRTIPWTDFGSLYEADQRHVEICMKEVDVEDNSREVSTPVHRSTRVPKNKDAIVNSEQNRQLLNPYMAIVASLNHWSQDSSDLQVAVKELGGDMSTPRQASWTKMKQVLRYLNCGTRAVLDFEYQRTPKSFVTWAGIDVAGCVKTRNTRLLEL